MKLKIQLMFGTNLREAYSLRPKTVHRKANIDWQRTLIRIFWEIFKAEVIYGGNEDGATKDR